MCWKCFEYMSCYSQSLAKRPWRDHELSKHYGSSKESDRLHLFPKTSNHTFQPFLCDMSRILHMFHALARHFTMCPAHVCGFVGTFLYMFLGPGSLIQAIKTFILLIGYFIQSMSSAVIATCPIDELDINSFVYSRPMVCAGFGLTQARTCWNRFDETTFGLVFWCFLFKDVERRSSRGSFEGRVFWWVLRAFLDIVIQFLWGPKIALQGPKVCVRCDVLRASGALVAPIQGGHGFLSGNLSCDCLHQRRFLVHLYPSSMLMLGLQVDLKLFL